MSHTQDMAAHRADSLTRRPAANPIGSAPSSPGQFKGRVTLKTACVVEVDRVMPDPDQPRKTFDPESLARLAESMKGRGQLVPILVRWAPDADRYVIVDGERRYRAALQADISSLAAVDVSGMGEGDILEVQLVINALREDVPPSEQARSYRRLMDAKGYSHRDLAERLKVSHSTITRALGILDLPAEHQAMVDDGLIGARVGSELARIEDDAAREAVAEQIVAEGLNQTEALAKVREAKAKPKIAKGRGASKPKAKPGPFKAREWSDDSPTIKLTATGKRRQSFGLAELLTALEKATARVRAEIEAEQGGDQAAA